MSIKIEDSWKQLLNSEFNKNYFKEKIDAGVINSDNNKKTNVKGKMTEEKYEDMLDRMTEEEFIKYGAYISPNGVVTKATELPFDVLVAVIFKLFAPPSPSIL